VSDPPRVSTLNKQFLMEPLKIKQSQRVKQQRQEGANHGNHQKRNQMSKSKATCANKVGQGCRQCASLCQRSDIDSFRDQTHNELGGLTQAGLGWLT
jgi:hypothetical protein